MDTRELAILEKDNALAGMFNNDINSLIGAADSYIRKQYLLELKDAEVVPINSRLDCIDVGKNVRLFKVTSLSYSQNQNVYEKITNLCNAVTEFDSSQIMILESDGYKADLYLGIASNQTDRLSMQFETFKSSFLGNFPGGKISMLNTSKNEALLNGFFAEPNIRVSAVSSLTTPEETTKSTLYGLEHLVDGMYGKPFTMIIISEAVAKREICKLRQGLEAIYTEITPYRDYTVSISANSSESLTQSYNLTKSESVTEGKSVTENTTFGTSRSKSKTTQLNQEEQQKKNARNQLIGTAASVAAIMAGLGGAEMNLLQGLFYGGSISNVLGSAQTLLGGSIPGEGETTGEGESISVSFSEAETTSQQKGYSASKGISEASTTGGGRSLQMRYENKSILNLLSVLDKQITRLQHIEERGGFQCAAYFITGDSSTALTVSNMYRSLLGHGNSLGQNNAINVWSDNTKVGRIGDYLKRLNHPIFQFETKPGFSTFTASSLIAADEYPMYASLPQKSFCGLPVNTHAEFARDIISMNHSDSDKLEIGNIYHMGKTEFPKVCLSKEDLRSHMFVAGSTGMGKSNFCYGLIDNLYKHGVKFMVIEPAKGEYSKVFGGYDDVYSFGTNPNLMPLLRINPFSFPDGVHVNEHINRLLEIFNSCWPMYAAMPAIMKEGIETIYKDCGFNLITGCSKNKDVFPTFADLLKVLPEILKKSRFSGEVQGNYIGSLVTRVQSLTDGLYGCIFTDDEIKNEILFDENVLIDLSRVGSGETKALIMGILVMKLQEYRMCNAQMNSPLKHITVLEEAHHLLKATTSSSAEGVNLRAMSLEMITNAIAEMRTYGEGFVIADQSPTLMDLSVIRNTNTKVVFKLPENSDRRAVGNAMSLNEEQITEISRLECGVAVVYQSNWDNAVLSKIRYFDQAQYKPYICNVKVETIEERDLYSQCAALLLRKRIHSVEKSSFDADLCSRLLAQSKYASNELAEYLECVRLYTGTGGQDISFGNICMYIDKLIDTRRLLSECGRMDSVGEWETEAKKYIDARVSLTEEEIRELILLSINIRIKDSDQIKKFYFKYLAHCSNA